MKTQKITIRADDRNRSGAWRAHLPNNLGDEILATKTAFPRDVPRAICVIGLEPTARTAHVRGGALRDSARP
jgi:hypothetical protein